jgi:hypothetical protein
MCNPLKDFLFCEYYIHKYASYYENLQYINYCKFLERKCKCEKKNTDTTNGISSGKFNRNEWKTDSNLIQQLLLPSYRYSFN